MDINAPWWYYLMPRNSCFQIPVLCGGLVLVHAVVGVGADKLTDLMFVFANRVLCMMYGSEVGGQVGMKVCLVVAWCAGMTW